MNFLTRYLVLLIILNSYSGVVLSSEIDFGASLEVELAQNIEERDNRQTQKQEVIFEPQLNIDFGGSVTFKGVGRIWTERESQFDLDKKTESELREFYFDVAIGPHHIKLGKQQIVWGVIDGLKILDVVNPQDFREFILDEYEDSRIPLYSLNADIYVNDSVLQIVWLPDLTYNKLPSPQSIYNFTSPALVPPIPTGVPINFNSTKKPDQRVADSDIGLRYLSDYRGWDFTLNYLYHYDDMPIFFRTISGSPSSPIVTINPSFGRVHLFGGTASNSFGNLTFRVESGYFVSRYFSVLDSDDEDGVVETNELEYALGFDWYGLDSSLISVQVIQSMVDNRGKILARKENETNLTLLVNRNFLHDSVLAEILIIHSPSYDDGLVRSKISNKIYDYLDVWLGVDIFYGDKTGPYGQFGDNDRLLFGFKATY